MADRDFPNSGVMYVNKNRRDGKNDAQGKGKAEFTCQHCGQKNETWVDGWRNSKDNNKPDKNGDPWWSFSFKPRQPQVQQQPSHVARDAPRIQRPVDIDDSEIPF